MRKGRYGEDGESIRWKNRICHPEAGEHARNPKNGKTRVMGKEVSRKVFDTRPVTQAESWHPSHRVCSSWVSIQVQSRTEA